MRTILLATLLSLSTVVALADSNVAGDWKSNEGSGVTIDMRVTPDGRWTSETLQGKNVVRRMSGSYTQTPPPSGNGTGEMVFTPTSTQGGSQDATVEKDSYRLSRNGRELRLTSGGDTMVFEKQSR